MSDLLKKVFWGASKCGLINLSFWRTAGFEPDYFTCNDETVWGTYLAGIPVISPKEVFALNSYRIYITSYARNLIRPQLLSLGVPPKSIYSLLLPFYASCPEIYEKLMSSFSYEEKITLNKHLGVSFEYSEGDSLAGTQSWANAEQLQLLKKGIPCVSLIPSDQLILKEPKFHRIILKRSADSNMFKRACEYFLTTDLNTFISMTGSEMLVAACFVKAKYSLNLKIYAFCHADTDEYYDSYTLLQDQIDKCFVISNKMKESLIQKGFTRNKIVYYPWKVTNLRDVSKLTYNFEHSLKIAYVGRVCVQQKRCDLLIVLAQILLKRNVNFILSIVGSGNYLNEMQQSVVDKKLQTNIVFIDAISHDEIYKFWDSQDIYVSCSEFEGHSLSQFEALSRGAVAVCTDCSGVDDDIINKFNGYICERGNLEQIADRIQRLDQDRILLQKMKKRTLTFFSQKQQDYIDPLLEYKGG